MVENWRVQVDMNGEMIVVIEPNALSGQNMTEEMEDVVRKCAYHLLSFVGEKPKRERSQLLLGPDVRDYNGY
jgi:hypothetical protein